MPPQPAKDVANDLNQKKKKKIVFLNLHYEISMGLGVNLWNIDGFCWFGEQLI